MVGDWVYFRTHNYKYVINDKKLRSKLQSRILSAQGENAFCTGFNQNGRTYSGLGLTNDSTARKLQEELIEAYNTDLEPVMGMEYEGYDERFRPPRLIEKGKVTKLNPTSASDRALIEIKPGMNVIIP